MRQSEATTQAGRDAARSDWGRFGMRHRTSRIPSRRWLAMLMISGGAVLGAAGFAVARDAPPTLIVAPQLPLIAGQESTLEIRVSPNGAIPPRALIIIKGTPPGIQIAYGRSFGPGVWVVPAATTTVLKLAVPSDHSGGGTITIVLATPEGGTIAQVTVGLVEGGRRGVPVNAPVESTLTEQEILSSIPAASPDAVSPSSPTLTAEKRAELLLLLQKGRDSLQVGNVMHARQFYLRAAESGLAEAALALAATYDPVELARIPGITGVAADIGQARKWYERAGQLGAPEAEAHLSALARE